MFHSSSIRHENYIRASRPKKATLNKKRSNTSDLSDDSGYTSSSGIKSKDKVSIRQPDLVYSCPRPLAFPFHNDDHFLPIAEADPRDVARVSPLSSTSLLYRSSSINSQSSTSKLLKKDNDSLYSPSLMSTIQRGTVRSLRSLFQLSNSKENQSIISNSNTNSNIKTNVIKQGTVNSIKSKFNQNQTLPKPNPIHPKNNNNNKPSPSIGLKVNVTPSENNKSSVFKEFKSKILNYKKKSSLDTKPLPKLPNSSSIKSIHQHIKSNVKKIIPSKSLFTWKSKDNSFQKLSTSNEPSTQKNTLSSPPPVPPKDSNLVLPSTPPTKVKKMWTSFRNFMKGKKSSRVGVL